VLVEADVDGSSTTTFTVDPVGDGRATQLTIATTFATRKGLAGAMERVVGTLMLRRIYRKELRLIAGYVEKGRA
jgi:hypothetical protein